MARIVWKLSRLGFYFSVGCPVGFNEWFMGWLERASDNYAIVASIVILWAI